MSTVLQLGAHMSIAGGVSQALDRGASIHCNAVQLFTKNNRQWAGPPVDKEDVARWHRQLDKLPIVSTVSHASYLINLASPKEPLWQKSLRAHADELARAHAYSISWVVLHPGSHTGSGVEAGSARIASALNQIHHQHPECADTMTLLEVMAGQGTAIGRSFAELRQILEQVEAQERVGVCLDTCHAFAAGYDLRSQEGYAAMMEELEAEIGRQRVACWHFNDSKGGLGSNLDRHTHIGQGELGLGAFAQILNDSGWAGVPMLLETPKQEDLAHDVMNLRTLCTLVDDPDRIPPDLRAQTPPSAPEQV